MSRLGHNRYADGYRFSGVFDTFGGLNRSEGAADGEIRDMKNMSLDGYPAFQTRGLRDELSGVSIPDAVAFAVLNGKFIWIINEPVTDAQTGEEQDCFNAYCNGEKIRSGLKIDAARRHTVLKIQNYIILFPEGYVLDGGKQEITEDGTVVLDRNIPAMARVYRISDGEYEGSASKNRVTILQKDSYRSGGMMGGTDQDRGLYNGVFHAYDAVRVYNTQKNLSVEAVIRSVTYETPQSEPALIHLDFYPDTFADIPKETGDAESALVMSELGYPTGWVVAREMPDMEYVFASNNRIFGCKGSMIYVSGTGGTEPDPYNFNRFEGIKTDSCVMEVDGEGDFTGGIDYNGYPMFFKENDVFKLYGSYPENYQLIRYRFSGVDSGCGRSLAVAGQYLFYVSHGVVYEYSGGVPHNISRALGEWRLCDASAATDGQKYYLSAKDQNGERRLLVYDTAYNRWIIEDDTEILFFGYADGVWIADGSGKVHTLGEYLSSEAPYSGAEVTKEDGKNLSFSFESANFYLGNGVKKRLHELTLRMEVSEGAAVQAYIRYDGGEKELIRKWEKKQMGGYTIPLTPRDCDSFRLYIEGKGQIKLYGITMRYMNGRNR